jgi:multisubunit Na+/H+ antiporter MnhB subunit
LPIEVAPLPSSFMLTSMVGYIFSIIWVYPRWPSFGFAFMLVFMMMFIASVISMTYAPEREVLILDSMKKHYKK